MMYYKITWLNILLKIKKEILFTCLILYIWTFNTLGKYFSVAVGKLPIMGDFLYDSFLPIIGFFLIIFNRDIILKSLGKYDLGVIFSILLYSCYTLYVDNSINRAFNEYFIELIYTCIPVYVVAVCYLKNQKLVPCALDILEKASMLCIVSCILAFNFSRTSAHLGEAWMSNQYSAYILLPHITILVAGIAKKIKIINLSILTCGLFYVFILGNRGSLLCFLIFSLMLFACKMKASKRIDALLVILCIFIGITYLYASNNIVKYLYSALDFAEAHGYSTRVIVFLLGDLNQDSFDSGRLYLQQILIRYLMDDPFGYGLAADKFFVGEYAHNVFLEILFEFGVIVGTPIVLYITIVTFICIWKLFGRLDMWIFFSFFLVMGLIKLFISGTYLTDPYFFAYLGLLVNFKKIIKKIKNI